VFGLAAELTFDPSMLTDGSRLRDGDIVDVTIALDRKGRHSLVSITLV
jgi:hypothetical protein